MCIRKKKPGLLNLQLIRSGNGAVTLRVSMGKSLPTSISVCVCLCVEKGPMLWSSDCKTVLRCMINQTDWMGQIWFVIAQRGSERREERERNGLLCCM